ncbi:MAG: sigma 54-interacting transcriptional regulator [Acidobacteria bacterium]|nr:sigma 54-interacting transcriptional regulator [Acidobacteriota bacterium]
MGTETAFRTTNIRSLLIDMAQERTVHAVLDLVVHRLAGECNAALARVWLAKPGDICSECRMRPECKDQSLCLHLVASAGASAQTGEIWDGLDGRFRRFPNGIRKVGKIMATAAPLEVHEILDDSEWIVQPEWVRTEGIRAFGGQPLVYRGEVLGVFAVFARSTMTADDLLGLRMIADHAATAIANARAFEEIRRLQRKLEQENEYLREEVRSAHGFGDILGQSSALVKSLSQVDLVAPSDASVLVTGESGTGKELIARAIHERSNRAQRPLVTVNCASVPHELFESEFFGHVRGAFTGAVRDRLGRFPLADGGTIFLDEIAEIPLELQGKLLRVLQEGTFERIGEDRTRKVDVRVIAATNRNLKQEVEGGRFREDLFYRLSVFPVDVAPLRERLEDIPLLAGRFLEEASKRLGSSAPTLRRRHIDQLRRYRWPGNVRELQNVMERAVIRAQSGPLEFELGETGASAPQPTTNGDAAPGILTYDDLKAREKSNLLQALEATRWRVSGPQGAARLLGLRPTTLASKIKAFGLGLNGPERRPDGSRHDD